MEIETFSGELRADLVTMFTGPSRETATDGIAKATDPKSIGLPRTQPAMCHTGTVDGRAVSGILYEAPGSAGPTIDSVRQRKFHGGPLVVDDGEHHCVAHSPVLEDSVVTQHTILLRSEFLNGSS